jgi:transposase
MPGVSPHFPKSHGMPRVDDCRVINGIIFVIRKGLRWRYTLKYYGPHRRHLAGPSPRTAAVELRRLRGQDQPVAQAA